MNAIEWCAAVQGSTVSSKLPNHDEHPQRNIAGLLLQLDAAHTAGRRSEAEDLIAAIYGFYDTRPRVVTTVGTAKGVAEAAFEA